MNIIKAFIITLALCSAQAYAKFDHTHTKFNKVLKTYVKESTHASTVDYKALKKNRKNLDDYTASLSKVTKKEFDLFSREQQMAFLINAYNAFTLVIITDHLEKDGKMLKSIKDIGTFYKSTWKIKFFTLLGEKRHLDYIEHEVLRAPGKYDEPRIHFAVNCASIGCPKLSSKAFTPKNLESMLESGTRDFLSDKTRNYYDKKSSVIYLSKLLDWYGGDFKSDKKDIRHFLVKYYSKLYNVESNTLIGSDLKYTDYDWNLNITR